MPNISHSGNDSRVFYREKGQELGLVAVSAPDKFLLWPAYHTRDTLPDFQSSALPPLALSTQHCPLLNC